jgi:hypothetical protein
MHNFTLSDIVVDGVVIWSATDTVSAAKSSANDQIPSAAKSLNRYTFENVQANHTLTANFVRIAYAIRTQVHGNGSITPAGGAQGEVDVPINTSQTFRFAEANEAWTVSDLKIDGVKVATASDYTFENVLADHTLAVTFSQKTAVLQTYIQSGGGQSRYDKFFSTGLERQAIISVEFVKTLPDQGTCTDISATDSAPIVACSTGTAADGYRVTIGSLYKMVANVDSSYFFANLAFNETAPRVSATVSGMANVDWSAAQNMSYMFYYFGGYAGSLSIDEFPAGFGAKAVLMDAMFIYFGASSHVAAITLPAFPDGFGSQATDMNAMFMYLGYSSDAASITLPPFPAGFGVKTLRSGSMFQGYASRSKVDRVDLPPFPAGFGEVTTNTISMFYDFAVDTLAQDINIYWTATDFASRTTTNKNNMFGRFAFNVPALANMYVKNDGSAKWFGTDSGWVDRPTMVPIS